jgi:chromosome segregation ATPase
MGAQFGRQVAEKEAQVAQLGRAVEALESKLAPLDADKAELGGRLRGLERRLKDAESAKAAFDWRCRGLADEKSELADMVRHTPTETGSGIPLSLVGSYSEDQCLGF